MKRGTMLDSAVLVTPKAVSHLSATQDRGRFCGGRLFDTQPQRKSLRLVAVVLGLCLCESVAALSLYDIIELSRSGYGEEEITSLIAVTGARFELDVDSLSTLKAAGVSEPVIRELLQAGDHLPSGDLFTNLTSAARTDASDRRDGALAETTVDDILQLYRAGLSEATILSFVRRRDECIPFSIDHLLHMAEAGLSQDFVSDLGSLMAGCRDQERLADAQLNFYVPSSRARRTYLPGIYDDFYYRARPYPYAIYRDHRQPQPQRQRQHHQGHLVETQGPDRELIHHVISNGDQIDHHHHEVVRDHDRVLVEDLPEHHHVGVSLAEHDALHPDHSAGVSADSGVAHRVKENANRPPQVTSSTFSMINRSTRSGFAGLRNRSLVSRSQPGSANSPSTRGSRISRSVPSA